VTWPKEAADLIALLVGQLADVPVQNNHAGAAPVVDIVEDGRVGRVVSRMGFLVNPG